MDCLRSFNFGVDLITTVSGVAELKQWTTSAGNHYWQTSNGITGSSFSIEGFKNINVYGIDVIGTIQTQTNIGVDGVIVNDWGINVQIEGQRPLIGNKILSPNYYAIDSTINYNERFTLGKFSNSLKLASPFESVKKIYLGTTFAQGIGYQTLLSVNLNYKLNFVVFYKFEGE